MAPISQYEIIKTRKDKYLWQKNERTIRSSATEFLIFEEPSHADRAEVIYQDGTLWMSQRMMGLLFDVESNTITYHLGEVCKTGKLEQI